MSRPTRLLFSISLWLFLGACSTIHFERTTESSGTFEATGTAFTIFSVDIPRSALNQARENASDAGMHNMVVTEAKIAPYWGVFDILLEIISVRKATIRGTWGYEEGLSPPAPSESTQE
jgi:hypothetical protein